MEAVAWYTSLGGDGPLDRKLIGKVDAFGGGALQDSYARNSPCAATNYPQLRLEPLMFEHASRSRVGKLNYNNELIALEQDADGVRATIRRRADDSTYVVHARYGLGLNSAIQDAHNLAWKLAMVLRGAASDALLDPYETERREITGRNVQWALPLARITLDLEY